MAKAQDQDRRDELLRHYMRGTEDMDTRRTRKNGWNDIVDAYMSKVPSLWPFTARVTDPRIRSAVLEKTARLLNAKLQGRLVPREGGDVIKARINNALLDFQWDYAQEGGSMLDKVAFADQVSRLFGAAFVLVYWDNSKNSNEIKLIDPRDIFFDAAAIHIKNAKWVQVREWSTWDKLEDRGYDVSKWKRLAKKGEITSDRQSNAWESIVKANRGLTQRTGEQDDPTNPIVEVVTEWKDDECTVWLPKHDLIVYDGESPYKHGKIPIAMLRYYPLGDDIYGEPEVECVLPMQRAINFFLSGTIDELSMAIRPPLKLVSGQYRKESIEYGPGAQWIVTRPDSVGQATIGQSAIQSFNVIYPALVGAFDNALGARSQGIMTEQGPKFGNPTATEVRSSDRQENSMDQHNQNYLSEFLTDIMLMWLANNKQYLFDDPTKKMHIIKIIGKDNVKFFQQMMLDGKDIPPEAMQQITDTIAQHPDAVTPEMLSGIMEDVSVPTNPIIENPQSRLPENYKVRSKLMVSDNGEEADLAMTPDDLDGDYDYIPDVKSMATGASDMQQAAREKALGLILNPQLLQLLQAQGNMPDIKELLVGTLEDAGFRDAERIFENANQQIGQGAPGAVPGGPAGPTGGPVAPGANANGGVPPGVGAVPNGTSPGGLPQPPGVQGQAPAPGSPIA